MNDSEQDLARHSYRVTFFAKTAVLVGFLLLALSCSNLAMAQTAQDFTKIYDSYLAAIKSGNYSQVAPLLAAEVRNQVKTAQDRADYMMMQKMMAPIRYETLFLNMSEDGKTAEVNIIETVAVPEKVQKEQKLPPTQRAEVVLKFVKEAGQWKMGLPLIMDDPDKRARPKDLNMGTRDDYAEGSNTEVGGPILRMEKQAAGTVFVLRVTDSEIAVFVPAAQVKETFVPGKILVVHGGENKADKLKFWADDVALYKEPAAE